MSTPSIEMRETVGELMYLAGELAWELGFNHSDEFGTEVNVVESVVQQLVAVRSAYQPSEHKRAMAEVDIEAMQALLHKLLREISKQRSA